MCCCICHFVPLLVVAGCATMKTSNTDRTAKEQLLISNSVDRALDKVDFQPFRGRSVFLQDEYLESVDKNYIVGSIRHRIFSVGGRLVDSPEHAEIILEARSGGVGTDTSEMFLGTPELNLPGPLPVSLPEVKLISRSRQTGTAKVGLIAYDANTRQPLGDGGVTMARSDDNHWFFLGVGPYRNGTVNEEVSRSLNAGEQINRLPSEVAFDVQTDHPPFDSPNPINFASGQREETGTE